MKVKFTVWTVVFVCLGLSAVAQNDLAKFFPAAAVPTGGSANVQQLVAGFISPIADDFGALSNNGWYNTAEAHKKFGFDFNVTMNVISAQSGTKYFSVPNTLNGVKFDQTVPTGGDKAPTAYGPESEFPQFQFTAGGNNGAIFLGPGGGNVSKDIPVGSLAIPTMQLGLGLFANTDIKLRYTPDITVSGTKLGNWGVGLKHDIKQHIPGIKMAPFSLSLLLAYSSLTATTDLSGLYSGSGQEGVGKTTGFTAQVLVSKSVAIVTFYGGLGYNSSKTTYSVNGTYNVDYAYLPGDIGVPLLQTVNLTNPYKQEYSSSGFRGTVGIRFKFGPIILNGDYSLVNSKGLGSAGLGFTIH